MAIYVNERVVADAVLIEPFDPNSDPENINGEFQFIKIHECNGFPAN